MPIEERLQFAVDFGLPQWLAARIGEAEAGEAVDVSPRDGCLGLAIDSIGRLTWNRPAPRRR